MKLYTPPTYAQEENSLIFLAGPIQGAPRWQDDAVRILERLNEEVIIASPRMINSPYDFNPEINGKDQINWERANLRIAGRKGAIIFWIPKQKTFDRNFSSYSKTTRQELGEWIVRHEHEKARVVVGVEEGAPGRDYIFQAIESDYPSIPFLSDLEETCSRALELLRNGLEY